MRRRINRRPHVTGKTAKQISMKRVAGLAFAGLMALGLAACEEGGNQGPPPPTVTAVHPTLKEIVEWEIYTGRFVPVSQVDIRARVSGYLDSVLFEDGQIVEKGDLLFVIDQRPFKVALEEAEARVASAEASLNLAERELARASKLLKSSNVSRSTYDQRLLERKVADASLAAAKAERDQAQLEFDFTEIRAPIRGRISDSKVDVGNLVTQGSDVLTRIVSLDPVLFEFDVSEADYLKYQRLNDEGRLNARSSSVAVSVKLLDEKEFSHGGSMVFVDNALDTASGTIRGQAQFGNADGFLTPGLFGQVRVPGSEEYEAILVPEVAINSDQSRKFVYVLGEDGKAAARYLELGPVIEDMRVVRAGLTPEDWVIIDGLTKIRNGAPVNADKQGEGAPEQNAPEADEAGGKTE